MTYLEYGKLAPQFELDSTNGKCYTRGQFRGKSGLVLIFFQPNTEIYPLLNEICEDKKEYDELNVHILGIGHATLNTLTEIATSLALYFPLLADPQGQVWTAYSGLTTPGYG